MLPTCLAATSVIGHLPSNCVSFQFILVRPSTSPARFRGDSSVSSHTGSSGSGIWKPGFTFPCRMASSSAVYFSNGTSTVAWSATRRKLRPVSTASCRRLLLAGERPWTLTSSRRTTCGTFAEVVSLGGSFAAATTTGGTGRSGGYSHRRRSRAWTSDRTGTAAASARTGTLSANP
jgi:hypothetical protein